MHNFLITNKSNIKYLSNFSGSSGFMIITQRKQYLFTDFRYTERAKKSAKKGIKIEDIKNLPKILKKHKIKIIGVEEDSLTVTNYKKFKKLCRPAKFKNISGKVQKIREIKKNFEISLIKKSQRINEKVFNKIKKIVQLRPRVTERDLAFKIYELAYEYGADDVSFKPIIAFGKNSAIPHHHPSNRKLKKKDVVLIDMGMKVDGYCSDMSRTILPKNPSKKQQEIYNLVLDAQINAIINIRPGMTGKKADELSRKIIEQAGYAENYGHAGGHGIGLDIHETPSLSEKYKDKFVENSVITVEPGIYIPGEFGVRIEDMILIKKDHNVNLTKAKK